MDTTIPLNEFAGFPKIARLSRDCVITEMIDGTNVQVAITETGELFFGSRNRWLTAQDDNFGFARWGEGNRSELLKLGLGRHFGEWWGCGVQRGYGLKEKRFSLFNVHRWCPRGTTPSEGMLELPECVSKVPVLYRGLFNTGVCEIVLRVLGERGSVAAPGFMQPEGIVIYHAASKTLFKKTLKNDESPKGT